MSDIVVGLRISARDDGARALLASTQRDMDGLGSAAQRTTGNINKLTPALRESAAAAEKLKALGSGQLFAANKSVNEYVAGLRRARGEIQATGLGAKETAFALRQVPLQVTDIVTGLASGQRPLQVLLQQGGQLKDSFGGVVPAVRALGGYLAGLINPLTITAAVVAGLGLAWKAAADEQQDFALALVATGRAGVTSTAQFRQMQSALDELAGVTGGDAAQALTAVAASGQLAEDQFQRVSAAALQMQQLSGQALDDTIHQFEALAKDPVEALLKLNETQHFLTQSTLDQVRALVEQGDQAGAAKVAIEAYADAIAEKSDRATAALSIHSLMWRNLKAAIGEATDEVVNFFRQQSNEQAFDKGILATLNGLQGLSPVLANTASYSYRAFSSAAAVERRAAINTPKIITPDDLPVDSSAERARAAAQKALTSLTAQFATPQQRFDAFVTDLTKQAKAAGKDVTSAYYQGVIEQARQKIFSADRGKSAAAARAADQALADQQALAKAQADADATLEASALKQAKGVLDAQLADRTISVREYYDGIAAIDRTELAAQTERLRAAIQQQTALLASRDASKRAAAQAELTRLNAQLAVAENQQALAEQQNARTARAAELQAAQDQLSRAQTVIRLTEQSAQSRVAIGLDTEATARRRVAEATREQAAALSRDLVPQLEAMLKAASDPKVIAQIGVMVEKVKELIAQGREKGAFDGLSAAVAAYRDKAEDSFGQAQQFALRTFQSMEDALTEFVTTGKLNFKSLVASILADLARIQIQKALSSLFDAFGGGGGGGGGSGSGGGDGGIFSAIISSLFGNAKGGVYSGPGIHAYSSQIVSAPTVFPFAKGIGLMGEAGAEAIMPLKRDSAGRLGVRVAEGAAAAPIQINVQVDAGGTTAEGGGEPRAADLGRRIGAAVRGVIIEEQRPGGLLASARN